MIPPTPSTHPTTPDGPTIPLTDLRVVAVHAHPDDESLWTGGLLAHLADRGATVTVVTCTLGEEGEVIGDTYQQLVAGEANQLGGFRIHELEAALGRLKVDGEFLGGAGRFRDSGMAGTPAAEHPRAFVRSGQAAVDALIEIIQRLRPHMMVTYGPDGGYGHPDHIHAHDITHTAVETLARRRSARGLVSREIVWLPRRILWAVTDRSSVAAGLAAITTIPSSWRIPGADEVAAVDHADCALALDEAAWASKRDAMAAHATQIWVADGRVSRTNPTPAHAQTVNGRQVPAVYALSNLLALPLLPVEHYTVGWGEPLPPQATVPWAGIAATAGEQDGADAQTAPPDDTTGPDDSAEPAGRWGGRR